MFIEVIVVTNISRIVPNHLAFRKQNRLEVSLTLPARSDDFCAILSGGGGCFSRVIRQLHGNDWLLLSCHHGYGAVQIARTTTLLERGSGLYSLAGTPFPVLPYFEREVPFIWLSFTKRPSSASMN
jgi:hypothetical protein